MEEVSVCTPKTLLLVCLLVLVGCSPSIQRNPFDRNRPSDCVPLPPTPTYDLRPRTPTPNLATQIYYRDNPIPILITVTPIPTPHYIDLSPKLRYEDKMVARVYRCNGIWDEYILDPAVFPNAIPLSRGDIIYDSAPPASLMGQRPPETRNVKTSTNHP